MNEEQDRQEQDWQRLSPLLYRDRVDDYGESVRDWQLGTEEGVTFLLDETYGRAIAYAIEQLPEGMFTATESDHEPRSDGQRRGWLRLRASSDRRRFGEKAAPSGRETVFQVARLVTEAAGGQRPERCQGYERTDYRREAFTVEPDAPNRTDTRAAFIAFCSKRGVDRDELARLFLTADALAAPDYETFLEEG